jgi:hypothetical protein
VLLRAGFGEEAAVIARSLFTDSLRMTALADADTQSRYALEFGWMARSVQEHQGLMRTAVRYRLDEEPDAVKSALNALNALYDRLQQIERARARFGITGKHRTFDSDTDMAERQGREGDLFMYRWSEEAVHGSEAAAAFLRMRMPDDVFAHRLRGSSPELMEGLAVFVMRSALAGHRAAVRFGWPAAADVDALWDKWSADER